jgi:predicted TIM-barrel fold metal-dependent hydrolase
MNRRGFSQLILAIIAGAVLVIGGGSFWYYQQSAGWNKSAPGAQVTAAPSPAPVVPGSPPHETLPVPVEERNQTNQTQTDIPTKQAPAKIGVALPPAPSTPGISCTSPADMAHVDIFDSHVHIMTKVTTPQVISEMDKAGVSMALLYPIDGDDDSSSLEAISKYPGRFIAFVDTPDSPQPSTWLTQGQAFVTFAEAQLKSGKFYGIGETNLRYYSGEITPPPTVSVPADAPVWLQLVDLSARYHVPISFHFVPDDITANAAFERMLNHNKDAVLIWSHLGFNNMPLVSATLNDFLLRYPNLYFDTAGIQNMQNPLPQSNSNWARLADQSNNGRLKEEWKKFFETWNSRILFGSDAGGGSNGLERWLNYTDNTSKGAPSDAIGHWKSLFSTLDSNAARNILSANARELFLNKQKPAYGYSVSSNGKCYSVSVSSDSSVSALMFNPDTRTITFTVAGSNGTTGNAAITIPRTLVDGNFTASVDGQSVKSQSTSNSTNTSISLEYTGGIRSIAISASSTP